MGPVRQTPIQRTARTAHLNVLMTVHNFSTQYSTKQFSTSDNLPSYLQRFIQCHEWQANHTRLLLLANTSANSSISGI